MLIAGLGVGLFVIFLFAVLSLCICAFGSRTPRPPLFYTIGTLLFASVLLLIIFVPKSPSNPLATAPSSAPSSTSTSPSSPTDNSYPARVAIQVIMILCSVIALFFLFPTLCFTHQQGSRINSGRMAEKSSYSHHLLSVKREREFKRIVDYGWSGNSDVVDYRKIN